MSNYDKSNVSKRYLKNVSFKELIIIRNNIFWVDNVNNGQNINKGIFTRPFNDKNAEPQQLTSDEFNIQSKFHGYGGDSYKCIYFRKHFYLIWIDQRSRALWMQIFESFEITDKSCNRYLRTVSKARQLCESMECNFDSSFVLTENNFLYGICEIRNKDFLFSLNIDRTKQDINLIKQFNSFAGDLSSNSSASIFPIASPIIMKARPFTSLRSIIASRASKSVLGEALTFPRIPSVPWSIGYFIYLNP